MKLDKNVLAQIEKIVKSMNLPCDSVDVIDNRLVFFHCSEVMENGIDEYIEAFDYENFLKMTDFEINTTTYIINLETLPEEYINPLLNYFGQNSESWMKNS